MSYQYLSTARMGFRAGISQIPVAQKTAPPMTEEELGRLMAESAGKRKSCAQLSMEMEDRKKRILDCLSDGEWRTSQEIVEECAGEVSTQSIGGICGNMAKAGLLEKHRPSNSRPGKFRLKQTEARNGS